VPNASISPAAIPQARLRCKPADRARARTDSYGRKHWPFKSQAKTLGLCIGWKAGGARGQFSSFAPCVFDRSDAAFAPKLPRPPVPAVRAPTEGEAKPLPK